MPNFFTLCLRKATTWLASRHGEQVPEVPVAHPRHTGFLYEYSQYDKWPKEKQQAIIEMARDHHLEEV